MRHDKVSIPAPHGIDWKGIGYLFSIAGALLLGAISWPTAEEPSWHLPALLAGVVTTIIGFGVRYMAHLREKREINEAKEKAKQRA